MLKGSFQAAFAGEYVLEAEDGAGNVATKSLTVTKTVPITLSEGAQIIREPWNQAADNGEYALDAARITGGRYDADRSKTETGRYQGAYEFVLLTGAEAPKDGAPPEEAQWRADTERLTGLKPGAYVLYLRDKNDPSNILHSDVTIGNAYIRYTAAVKRAAYGQSNGAIYVTGLRRTGRRWPVPVCTDPQDRQPEGPDGCSGPHRLAEHPHAPRRAEPDYPGRTGCG